jgi:hypothetical protein
VTAAEIVDAGEPADGSDGQRVGIDQVQAARASARHDERAERRGVAEIVETDPRRGAGQHDLAALGIRAAAEREARDERGREQSAHGRSDNAVSVRM